MRELSTNLEASPLSRKEFLLGTARLAIFGYAGMTTLKPNAASASTGPEFLLNHEKYPRHRVEATIFWIGEGANKDNFGISNAATEWDEHAAIRFGGVDNPKGYPYSFQPKENPYYFALPASEIDSCALIPGARQKSPWHNEAAHLKSNQSLFKGRWIRVVRENRAAYGQWLDTGPSNNPNAAKDYRYVFGDGSVPPKNHSGLHAGIDLSPTLAHRLGFGVVEGGAEVVWQFVNPGDVPDGPWKKFPAIDNTTHLSC